MRCTLRNIKRISSFCIAITCFQECLDINIRSVNINRRRCMFPYRHQFRHRSSRRVFSWFLTFIKPTIYCHRKIIFLLPRFCNCFYKPCRIIALEYFICHFPKNFTPTFTIKHFLSSYNGTSKFRCEFFIGFF